VAALFVLSPTLYPPRLLFCEKKAILTCSSYLIHEYSAHHIPLE